MNADGAQDYDGRCRRNRASSTPSTVTVTVTVVVVVTVWRIPELPALALAAARLAPARVPRATPRRGVHRGHGHGHHTDDDGRWADTSPQTST